MKKTALRLTVALGVTLSPMLVASPASAGVWGPFRDHGSFGDMCIHSFDNCKGYVRFTPDGDIVRLQDIPGDGYGVRLRVKNVTKDPDATEYTRTAYNESIVVTGRRQPGNLAEKHCFRITIWLVDNGRQVSHKHYTQVRNYNNDGPNYCHDVE